MTTTAAKLEAAITACDAADAAWERACDMSNRVKRAARTLEAGGTLLQTAEDCLYDVCRTELSFTRTYDLTLKEAAAVALRITEAAEKAAWAAWQDAITEVEKAEKAAARAERRREARKAA
jgi:hypothetical protein